MLAQKGTSTRFLVVASAFLILMAPIFAIVPAQKAFAANKTWDGGGLEDPSNFHDCGNWNEDTCPTGSDNIVIDAGRSIFMEGFTLESDGSLTIISGTGIGLEGHLANHGTMNILGRFGISSERELENYGSVFIDGTLSSSGDIRNRESGLIQINGGGSMIVEFPPGTIDNDGKRK
jgi:hypothetical protein